MRKIFVNGTFDIIHRGHIEMLNYARSLGDYLLVAIDTDTRVQQLKGLARPINTLADREYLLSNLKAVDQVVSFDSDQGLESIIKQYAPDVMVKGSDYIGRDIIGAEHCAAIEFYQLVNGYSTTQKIQDIVSRR
jgi:D-beta-D-heptose 7-phosphate kinase/D-beta-D-heptose 1-phosphate adenosyltransferase